MTLKSKENTLNTLLSDSLTQDEAVKKYGYLTNKKRMKPTTEAHIRMSHAHNKLGTLLRRIDVDSFNCYDTN